MSRTILACLLLLGCGDTARPPQEPATPATEAPRQDDDVAQAAAIANAIARDPERADAILAEHGTTRAAFEQRLFEIAGDPAKSAAYARARE